MADERGKALLPRWLLVRAASIDAALSRADLAVLIAILDRMNDGQEAWPSLGTVAKDACVDRSSVVRSLKRLVDGGYLSRESGSRTASNRYRLGQGRCTAASRCDPASRCEAAPGVGANSYTKVGAAVHPELTHKNLPNEPSAAAAADAARPADPIWGSGLQFLGRKNVPERQARSFLGHLCRQTGQVRAVALLAEAEALDVVAPVEWLAKAAQTRATRSGGQLPRDQRSEDEIAMANEAALARLEALV